MFHGHVDCRRIYSIYKRKEIVEIKIGSCCIRIRMISNKMNPQEVKNMVNKEETEMTDTGIKLVRAENSRKEYKRIKKLYNEAFPADERAPLFLLKKRAKQKKGDSWSIYDGSEWIGWIYMITYKNLAYVNYLAIDNQYRGKGYGIYAIEELKKKYKGKNIFLALEQLDSKAENYVQRLKRHDFYERCGLKDLPYKIKEATVVYAIMGTGETVEPEEYKEMMDKFLGRIFTRLVDARMLKD